MVAVAVEVSASTCERLGIPAAGPGVSTLNLGLPSFLSFVAGTDVLGSRLASVPLEVLVGMLDTRLLSGMDEARLCFLSSVGVAGLSVEAVEVLEGSGFLFALTRLEGLE